MITNSTASDFNGAVSIAVTSDANAVPGPSLVVAREVSVSPRIDGVDDGASEWGTAVASTIPLSVLFGTDNGVASTAVRFAYDRNNLYAQFVWTETATGSFIPNADTVKNRWRYNGSSWSRSGGEDKLYLMWELNDISNWDAQGLAAVFDGSNFRTQNDGELADLWLWQSTETYYAKRAADLIAAFSATDGLMNDIGTPISMANVPAPGNRPRFMRSNSASGGSPSPLLAFEYAPFVSANGWIDGATIPGYVTMVPSGSLSDVLASAAFSGGVWTVELRRARNTGHADDLAL